MSYAAPPTSTPGQTYGAQYGNPYVPSNSPPYPTAPHNYGGAPTYYPAPPTYPFASMPPSYSPGPAPCAKPSCQGVMLDHGQFYLCSVCSNLVGK
jgi:hypothetical protein